MATIGSCVTAWSPVGGRVWGGLGGRCGLAEGDVLLRVHFQVSKAHAMTNYLSLPRGNCLQMQSLSYCSSAMPASCHVPYYDGHGLTLWNCKQGPHKLFLL